MPLKIVKTAKQAADAQFVVCNRVKDVPIPPQLSEIKICTDCGERIWLAHSTPRVPAPLICMQCASDRFKSDSKEELEICITEHQLDVVAEYVKAAEKGNKN